MIKICAGSESLRLPPACNKTELRRRGCRTIDWHGAPKKQIFPLPLPQPLRTSRTINRRQNPRPKFCAARPESVQPGRLELACTKQNSDRQRPGPEVTTSALRCARSPNLAADRQTSHQPLAKPDDPNPRHPIIICAAAVQGLRRPFQSFHVLSLEYLHFRLFAAATWHAV
jgi:hypothetical protein